jgi:hypothetical protein
LYCPPESIDLPDNYIALLKMYAKNQQAPHIRRMLDENGLTPMFLGLALQEAFPCSKYKAR